LKYAALPDEVMHLNIVPSTTVGLFEQPASCALAAIEADAALCANPIPHQDSAQMHHVTATREEIEPMPSVYQKRGRFEFRRPLAIKADRPHPPLACPICDDYRL
jgi:hypothetical protein